MRRKILIITDSLGFPRPRPEDLSYEETYIFMLKAKFPEHDFIHCGKGGATIDELFTLSVYFHQSLKPDIVFIQAGIVDCAPRSFSQAHEYILPRIPALGPYISKMMKVHSRRIRNLRKITWTSPSKYSNYIDRFERVFKNVHWIATLPASDEYEIISNGIKKNIENYNKILGMKKIIETNDILYPNDIFPDFHHPNINGHRKIFEKVASIIASCGNAAEYHNENCANQNSGK